MSVYADGYDAPGRRGSARGCRRGGGAHPHAGGARVRRHVAARARAAPCGAARAAGRAAGADRRRRATRLPPGDAAVREDPSWRVASAPADLQDRRVEITGPVDRKMVINALNSGAKVFMADFEDANSPTWTNCVEGQSNLIDAVERTISLDTGEKQYRLNDEIATLLVRPRGWHLREKHVTVDGEPVSAGLFDFGLYMFHSAERQLQRRVGAVLLSPEAREPPRGAALERRVRPRAGHARPAAGDDPRHRPHRDDPRRVRDGGDPLRAARPLGGAQRRALGLHVQRHQEVPRPAGVRAARPAARDDDRAVHARVHGAAREDVPPARGARDRRHGRVHPQPPRSRGERRRAGEGLRGQAARGGRRLRRHVGRASRSRADGEGGVRRRARLAARTRSSASARTWT